MKISIIMPCRNGERYLPECLRSIEAQNFSDFEVLMVDDGSQDGTRAILKRAAARDARFHVLIGQGQGVSAARNMGIEQAQGEWLAFVDCDDLLPEDALSSLISAEDDGVDLIAGAHETFDEHGKTELFWPQFHWMDRPSAEHRRILANRLIEGDSVLNIMCNKLHRRSHIEKEHIRLNPKVRIAEDALFNLEAVLTAEHSVYVHHITYRYRMHSASAMGQASGSAFELHRPWLEEMRRMLLSRGKMEAFYVPYLDSVTLRLYKDGGIRCVMERFNDLALPMVDPGELALQRMDRRTRRIAELVRSGTYPRFYQLIAAEQIARRKASEMNFWMREKRERKLLMERV